MPIWLFVILLTGWGMWFICDGWFSLSVHLRDEKQTWGRDHSIRVIRLFGGIFLIYLACVMGHYLIGG